MHKDSECVVEHQEKEPAAYIGHHDSDLYPNKQSSAAAEQRDAGLPAC